MKMILNINDIMNILKMFYFKNNNEMRVLFEIVHNTIVEIMHTLFAVNYLLQRTAAARRVVCVVYVWRIENDHTPPTTQTIIIYTVHVYPTREGHAHTHKPRPWGCV